MGELQSKLKGADVVVVGGGTSGAIAAIASARNGADTLVVESDGFLGGTSTFGYPFLGFFNGKGEQAIAGIAQEVVDRLIQLNASPGHVRGGTWSTKKSPITYEFSLTPYDPETLKYLLLKMAEEAGARLLFHGHLSGTRVEGGALREVDVFTKSGTIRVRGKVFVDGTGDADLASLAGAPCELGSREGLLQNVTLHFRMIHVDAEKFVEALEKENRVLGRDSWYIRLVRGKGPGKEPDRYVHIAGHMDPWEVSGSRPPLTFTAVSQREGDYWFNMTRTVGIDPTNVDDLTRAEITERQNVFEVSRLMIKNVPGFERAYLVATSPRVGVRESRRVTGEYILTMEDVLTCRRFGDGVAMGAYPIDIHDPKGGETRFSFLKDGGSYNIPYRCLVPLRVDNLIIAGKNISATHEAIGTTRLQPVVMAIGQAAGTAAAMAAKMNVLPRSLDPQGLRKKLQNQGALTG